MKTLKIWIGRYFDNDPNYSYNHSKQAVIVAYTKKQAIELSGISNSELTNYFSHDIVGELGNELIKSTCTTVGFWIIDNPQRSDETLRRVK